MMVLLKGCPRCKGDLFTDPFEDKDTLVCLQCSRTTSIDKTSRGHWDFQESSYPVPMEAEPVMAHAGA